MSIDRTLKSRTALVRHRNVLTRVERIELLAEDGLWEEDRDSVFGLPKVAHRKSAAGKKVKKVKTEAAVGTAAAQTEVETTAKAAAK